MHETKPLQGTDHRVRQVKAAAAMAMVRATRLFVMVAVPTLTGVHQSNPTHVNADTTAVGCPLMAVGVDERLSMQ
eukprot:CAMPEP_0181219298 /NCGR_PEP_ID=MMETSP1096-20121128/28185_1 /TAXON_ID=156174 ORGANISM="Chrysochromulina ericina, Strain CCMP281" /NCGR_SAMPLE_ID=MMETSP1096 /ASSEMBLY_ACC=CAM_ASM_000453 /LENGTH=74 /DNA_ID=CAMNT_0023311637 /DNA_START=426 /DNA_END=650 /DNA_ORIENTATION=-